MGKLKSTEVPGLFYRDGKRGKSYLIDRSIDGDRLFFNIGRVSLTQAKRIFNKKCAEFQDGKQSSSVSIRSLTVQDIFNYYWENHLKHIASGIDRKYHLSAVADRMGRVRFSDLNKAVIEKYKRDRSNDRSKSTGLPISKKTLKADLTELNSAINYLVDMEILPSNPISRFCTVRLPEPKRIVIDEGFDWGPHWQAIYENACMGWEKYRPDAYRLNRFLLLTLYETAMRPVEAFRMKHNWWSQLQPGFWVIKVPAWADKTSKSDREIPVSDRLWQDAKDFIKPDSPDIVFPSSHTGQQRSKYGIRKTFDRAVNRAGLEQFGYTPYALRRTRTSIWDAIDMGASRVATGHTPKDSHDRNYVRIGYERLFNLVGKSYKTKFAVISKTG